MDAKPTKMPVDSSAGALILSLVPGDERVALVLNIESMEVQVVPKEFLAKRRYKDALVEERENDAVVSFIQGDGWGTPFGKEEPEDGKDRTKTAVREAEEETGTALGNRLIPSIFYSEQPNYWSAYFNIVFLANGVGFSFNQEAIKDENVDAKHSCMWPLRRLPIPRKQKSGKGVRKEKDDKRNGLIIRGKRVGIYKAALRRIIAILLQLKEEHLAKLGRLGAKNAEDLVQIVVTQITYRDFFSQRTLKMLAGLGRLDVALSRLKNDKGILYNPELAASIGSNLILWLPYKPADPDSMLNEMLKVLLDRCDISIRSAMGSFLVDRLERREKEYLVSLDRKDALTESDEKAIVVADEDDFEETPETRALAAAFNEKILLD